MNNNKRKNEIEDIIYEGDLSLEQLFKIREEMIDLKFKKSDMDYVDELINDNLEEIESLEQLEENRKKLKINGIDTKYVDKLINRMLPVTKETLLKMDKEDLEFIIYERKLNIEECILVINSMKKFDFDDCDFEEIYYMLNEQLENIESTNELKCINKKMKDCDIDTRFISNLILDKNRKLDNEDSQNLLLNVFLEKIQKLPIEVLIDRKENLIKQGKDKEVNLIKKVIKDKIRNGKKEKHLEKDEFDDNTIFDSLLLLSLFNKKDSKDKKKSWIDDQIDKGNYESFNFEEEELEEDDYYYEDDVD